MRPRPITIEIRHGVRNAWFGPEWYQVHHGRPPLTYIALGFERNAPRGYRFVRTPQNMFDRLYADWYVWPWVWLWYRALIPAYWTSLRWLITNRWLRLTSEPHTMLSWRDLRLQLRRCACWRYDKCLAHDPLADRVGRE